MLCLVPKFIYLSIGKMFIVHATSLRCVYDIFKTL